MKAAKTTKFRNMLFFIIPHYLENVFIMHINKDKLAEFKAKKLIQLLN